MNEQTGYELGMAGADKALAAALKEWKIAAQACLERLARAGVEFTADDLVAHVGLPRLPLPGMNNAVGGAIARFARSKRIHRVGYRPSIRPQNHGRVVAIWRGSR